MAQRPEEYWMTMGFNPGTLPQNNEHGEALAIYNLSYRIEHGLVMYYPNYNDPPILKGESMVKGKYKVVPTKSGLHEVVEDTGDGTTKKMDPRQLFTVKHAAQRYAKHFNENEKKKGGPHQTTEEE